MINGRWPKRILLIAALAALNGNAAGQEMPPDNLPQVYQVEVILFRYTDPSGTSTETAAQAQPTSPEDKTADADSPQGEMAAPAETGKLLWFPADTATGGLVNASRRLTASAGYKMLAYRSWLQLAPEQGDARSIELSELNIEPGVASGQLMLFQKQFLYLAAEIQFPDANAGDARIIAGSRKLPLGKAIYFDDPQFGLIAMVSRSDQSWPGPTNPGGESTSESAE